MTRTGRAVKNPKCTVEDCSRISVKRLRRDGHFTGLTRSYRRTVNISTSGQSVHLVSTDCYYGGVRWWFLCTACSKRVGVLYKPWYAEKFYCRHCYRLTYYLRRLHRDRLEGCWRLFMLQFRADQIDNNVGQKGMSKRQRLQMDRLIAKVPGAARLFHKFE